MASTAVSPHPLHLLLPRLGTDKQFAALRELLRDCGFTGEGICRRLEIPSIATFKPRCEGRTNALEIEGPIDALIRLVLDGEFVAQSTLDSLLPAGALALMEGLQILARDPARPGELFSTITMYPAEGTLLLAGDRPGTPDGSPYWLPPDVVYPGVIENTRQFLATLPQTPCEAMLDLGTGSGVAALSASGYARHAWGTDIAGRSVRFAEFNRRLNGIDNVTMVEGDLYQPVEGLTFDRIVAHLPYVPARRTKFIFRDGGEDGEEILRRTIEGLPAMLRPGGQFHTLVTAPDCDDETFEDRIRRWLGADASQFDLVLVAHKLTATRDLLANLLSNGSITLDDWQYCREIWERRKVMFLFNGSVLIRRHRAPRPAFTTRLLKGEGFTRAHTEWLLDWETEVHNPAACETLLNSRPTLGPHCELAVFSAVQDGRFAPQGFSLRSKRPFESECVCKQWLARLISGCDGQSTWREQGEKARQAGWIDPATTPEELVELLGPMVANGFLRIPEKPMPEC